MKIHNRQQLLAVVAIGAIAYLAVEKILIRPLWKSWQERSEKVVQLRKRISDGRNLLQREKSIQSRWEQWRRNTLPTDPSVAEQKLLQSFDNWARASRISVTSVAPQKRENEDYTAIECRVDASGSISTVTRFLYDLEKDPIGLKVDSVEITSRDNEGQQIALGLQVSGLILKPQPK